MGLVDRQCGGAGVVDRHRDHHAAKRSPASCRNGDTPPTTREIAYGISFLTLLVGGILFFFPVFARQAWPWDLANAVNVRLLGSVFLGVGIAAMWVARQPRWYGYDLFYLGAGVFAAVALLASFLHWNLFAIHPISRIIFVIVYIVGALLGFVPYSATGGRSASRLPDR